MSSKLGRRVASATAAAALVAGASALFGGVAFAGVNDNDGGFGGAGGGSNANCVIPIGASAGVIGQGGPVGQCNATGGAGGPGGGGAAF